MRKICHVNASEYFQNSEALDQLLTRILRNERPLWVISGPSAVYQSDVRFRGQSGRSDIRHIARLSTI